MLILGLDPGSVKCGYGVIRAAGQLVTYVECGVLTAPAGHEKYARLAEIGTEVDRLLEQFRPEAVALEAGFVGPVRGFMMQGILVSAAARGVCGAAAARRGIPVFEYSPSTVKKHAVGNGRAKKDQVAKLIALQLRMERVPAPDAGDALAVALTHARQLVGGAPVVRAA